MFFKYLVDDSGVRIITTKIPDKQEVDSMTPQPPPPQKNVDSGW